MLQLDQFTIGWITALPLEMAAAIEMLDEEYGKPNIQNAHDYNNYILGRIGLHNIVIACLPTGVYGTTSAAVVAVQMMASFRSIRFGLMVGIGGGIPSATNDIRLGDVVVGKPSGRVGGVIQYDFGKTTDGGRFDPQGSLNKPPQILLTAVSTMQALHLTRGNQIQAILSGLNKSRFYSQRPGQDRLFEPNYSHENSSASCDHCDARRLMIRPGRPDTNPVVFYGTIASGNQVIKDARTRDQLGQRHGVLCFEMEAAGLMDNFPCLVIRGICDYADSHKAKDWQAYAAITAAACAKELLGLIPIGDWLDTHPGAESGGQTPSLPEAPRFPSTQSFKMTHSLYGIQDLTLASLIPDYRYPHLDALAPRVVEPGKDFSVSSDYNIHDIFHSTPIYASRPGRRLAKWFRFSSDANSENDITQWRMQAQESRLYMLRQPQAIFKDLCLNSTVRQWLQETFENRADAYFLIGYRSVINATLIRQDKNATEQGSYKTTGERIIAVCYRKVTFRFLKKSDSASLDRDNCWRLFSDDRGDDNEGDVMLEADIMDGDDIDECDVSDLED